MEEKHEETTLDPHYLKGFNHGYLLAGHDPQVAAMLAARKNDHNAYFRAMMAGKEQYEKEIREWTKSFNKSGPAKDDRNRDKER